MRLTVTVAGYGLPRETVRDCCVAGAADVGRPVKLTGVVAAGSPTVSCSVPLASTPLLSTAYTVKVNDPAAAGVPDNVPLSARLNPGGRVADCHW